MTLNAHNPNNPLVHLFVGRADHRRPRRHGLPRAHCLCLPTALGGVSRAVLLRLVFPFPFDTDERTNGLRNSDASMKTATAVATVNDRPDWTEEEIEIQERATGLD